MYHGGGPPVSKALGGQFKFGLPKMNRDVANAVAARRRGRAPKEGRGEQEGPYIEGPPDHEETLEEFRAREERNRGRREEYNQGQHAIKQEANSPVFQEAGHEGWTVNRTEPGDVELPKIRFRDVFQFVKEKGWREAEPQVDIPPPQQKPESMFSDRPQGPRPTGAVRDRAYYEDQARRSAERADIQAGGGVVSPPLPGPTGPPPAASNDPFSEHEAPSEAAKTRKMPRLPGFQAPGGAKTGGRTIRQEARRVERQPPEVVSSEQFKPSGPPPGPVASPFSEAAPSGPTGPRPPGPTGSAAATFMPPGGWPQSATNEPEPGRKRKFRTET